MIHNVDTCLWTVHPRFFVNAGETQFTGLQDVLTATWNWANRHIRWEITHKSPTFYSNVHPVIAQRFSVWEYRESEFTLEQISSPMIDKSTRANILAMYFALLCCAPLCCAVLRCVVLCCAPLCCAPLCCAMLLCCVRCCVVLRCCVVSVVVLCSVVLCCAPLCCLPLCCALLWRHHHENIFFLHNLGRSFHIWWQIEAALSGLDFSKWPPDWCKNNF